MGVAIFCQSRRRKIQEQQNAAQYLMEPEQLIEDHGVTVDRVCIKLYDLTKDLPGPGKILSRSFKAIAFISATLSGSKERLEKELKDKLSKKFGKLQSKIIQVRDVLNEQIESQVIDGKLKTVSTIYQQDLSNSVTNLCNWVAVKQKLGQEVLNKENVDEIKKKLTESLTDKIVNTLTHKIYDQINQKVGGLLHSILKTVNLKDEDAADHEIQQQYDQIDSALEKYILMKMFDRLEDPMPPGIKGKYKSCIGYKFWVNNFNAEMRIKRKVFGVMMKEYNRNVHQEVIDKVVYIMDSDKCGFIDLVEYFEFMGTYKDYFEEEKKKLIIIDEDSLMNKLCRDEYNEDQYVGYEYIDSQRSIDQIGLDYVDYKDGYNYKGGLIDKNREGHGTLEGLSYKYTGQWQQNKRHGKGQEVIGTQVFEGTFWKDHKKQGIMKYANGYVYDGAYQREMKNGQGRLEMVGDEQIEYVEGVWNDNVIKVGTIKMKNGNIYNGQIKSNMMKHGKGIICDSNKTIIQIGEYYDDELVAESKQSMDWIKCKKCNENCFEYYNQLLQFFNPGQKESQLDQLDD